MGRKVRRWPCRHQESEFLGMRTRNGLGCGLILSISAKIGWHQTCRSGGLPVASFGRREQPRPSGSSDEAKCLPHMCCQLRCPPPPLYFYSFSILVSSPNTHQQSIRRLPRYAFGSRHELKDRIRYAGQCRRLDADDGAGCQSKSRLI